MIWIAVFQRFPLGRVDELVREDVMKVNRVASYSDPENKQLVVCQRGKSRFKPTKIIEKLRKCNGTFGEFNLYKHLSHKPRESTALRGIQTAVGIWRAGPIGGSRKAPGPSGRRAVLVFVPSKTSVKNLVKKIQILSF